MLCSTARISLFARSKRKRLAASLGLAYNRSSVPASGLSDAPAGSPEKIEILRRRVESGLPLWHEEDRFDYSGLTGAVRPRE